MHLMLVGCSHQHADVAARERLAFSPDQAADALTRWREHFPATEAVLLSTCNRVELYTAGEAADNAPTQQQVIEFLAACRGLQAYEVAGDLLSKSGGEAVQHLFTVAASLDSMVLGEPQILAQVKQAYALAQRQQCVGPLTHEVFQAALHVAKRIAGETALHEKRISIPSVAVAEFAGEIFDRFDDKHVLVIGAGEMADETLTYLRTAGARNITVVNRNYERAAALAEKHLGGTADWNDLDRQLITADMVVSTTGATEPIVTLSRYQALEPARRQRPLLILDLAMPRDFAPEINNCLNVYLYAIDDLRAACERNRGTRDRELPKATRIIEQETQRFLSELHHRATRPIIQQLRDGWQSIRDQELKRLYNKVPELSDTSRREIEQTFERIVNKLLHPPLESLRDEARHGTPQGLLDTLKALKRLFRLPE